MTVALVAERRQRVARPQARAGSLSGHLERLVPGGLSSQPGIAL